MTTTRNKEIALRYMKLIEQGDIDGALALAADDARFWHPSMGDADKGTVRAAFTAATSLMTSFKTNIRSVTAEGDRVAVEAEVDIDVRNGRHYHNKYHFMFEIRDAKIQASREYVDTEPFRAAFG